MTKNMFKFGFLILLIAVTSVGCFKVGEEDPGISLRSRSSRISGEWKMSAGTWTETEYNAKGSFKGILIPTLSQKMREVIFPQSKGETFTVNYSYDGAKLTASDASGNTEVMDFTSEIIIDKDGSFTRTEYWKSVEIYGDFTYTYEHWSTYEGTWYFMEGNDDLEVKDNERVAFQISKEYDKYSYNNNGTIEIFEYTDTYEGASNSNVEIFTLSGLANKEMIVTLDQKQTDSDGDFFQIDGSVTYIQE